MFRLLTTVVILGGAVLALSSPQIQRRHLVDLVHSYVPIESLPAPQEESAAMAKAEELRSEINQLNEGVLAGWREVASSMRGAVQSWQYETHELSRMTRELDQDVQASAQALLETSRERGVSMREAVEFWEREAHEVSRVTEAIAERARSSAVDAREHWQAASHAAEAFREVLEGLVLELERARVAARHLSGEVESEDDAAAGSP